ncbi:hydroxyproline-rich glycoprotein DZ-HRGP [Hirsutella rhossiliensis]|uniref:Hydroxyproline-rich glycoprotein DZ-HRGP n=1 Tax=Hirsutella rhossiliensis TaxID=111463 RepID=A0A9P8SMP4_9HYPO|nr:hydroxyproline-rich glycoprotein DZ-HRGP [Hirsutella rhossiliensis]KAH0968221.1 hydroxyproline-rich glycoprotein DZ-HRGP [Hirsutella rhossiliensis]
MASGGVAPTKKQVEDVVRGTNLGDLGPAWIDDLVGLVQSKLSSSCDSTDASEPSTPSDVPSTPSSELSEPPDWFPGSKPFQATVEDEDCSTAKERSPGSMASQRPSSNTSRRRPPKLDSSNTSMRPPTCLKDAPLEKTKSSNPPFAPSAPSSPKLRPTVHFSERPPPRLNSRVLARSDSAAKTNSVPELSVVDLQWGRLFTGCGEPTTRLRQVLRGLANYINAEYEPKNSVVITPGKLYTFYKRCQLDVELYPFQVIFDCSSRKPMRCLELFYQDLRCEYHLVQGESRDRPYIPALTSDGFVNWMSAFIQASPDAEAKRLDGIMAALPIEADSEAPNEKPERLPKQLSRHLFPSRPHERTCQYVSNALKVWYDAQGLSNSRPPSYLDAFRNLFARSLSPRPRDRDRREDRGQGSARDDRETFIEVIEVPPGHSSDSQRSSGPYPRTRDWDEYSTRSSRSSRSSGKVLVEEASRHSRDASPRRRHHRHHRREGSPRPSKHRHSGAASGYASSLPRTTPPSSREGSPKASANRAENYAFFQGRESGPTYEGILRETPTTRRTQRASRHRA